MKKKYYAVKKGLTPGIYTDWDSCKIQVNGFPGAEYKGFTTEAEAISYMGDGWIGDLQERTDIQSFSTDPADVSYDPDIPSPDPGCAIAYVDGSFMESAGKVSYGIVMFITRDDGTRDELQLGKAFTNPELLEMRNVSGEIIGAAEAMKRARQMGLKEITIYHDYEGIAKWCLGEWKTNKPWVIKYKAFYDDISQYISVKYVKVKGHSNDRFNDMADELAKKAIEDNK